MFKVDRLGPLHLVLALLALGILSLPLCLHAQQANQEAEISAAEFYAKHIDCGGIPVRSSSSVDDKALEIACNKISMMLNNIPQIRANLVQRGAELHIIGHSENTSDLPEFRSQRGVVYTDNTGKQTTIDLRTRGKGGLMSSCGEENILHLPGDRYGGGADICIHEFAHAIMDYGFNPAQRQLIKQQYAQSMSAGLWQNAYAATNPQEFWAELSMWYFGAHGDRRMNGTPPADGRDGLRSYDPNGFSLLEKLYNGYN